MFCKTQTENTVRPLLEPFLISLSRKVREQAYLDGLQRHIDSIISIIADFEEVKSGLSEQLKSGRLTQIVMDELLTEARAKASERISSLPDWSPIEEQLKGRLDSIMNAPQTDSERLLDYLKKKEVRDQFMEADSLTLKSAILQALDAGDILFARSFLDVPARVLCRIPKLDQKEYEQRIAELLDPETASKLQTVQLVNEVVAAMKKTAIGLLLYE